MGTRIGRVAGWRPQKGGKAGQIDMSNELPETVKTFLEQICKVHGTTVEIREVLPMGKSSAFVALVDCSGAHDGVYVLKVDALPIGREDEETRHKQALRDGAFSGKLPAIVLSERTGNHYCLLMKIVGESRIAWRPLVAALGLFRSAYSKFATIAWTPPLFTFGTQAPAAQIVSDAVGYKLIESKGGRIKKHISEFVGNDFLSRRLFVHNEQLLPNPFVFAGSNAPNPILRPAMGPVHGDCHMQNLFVRASQDSSVSDVYLIDLATYQSHSLFFFDHAYLELATMLRQMDQLGERRWLEFVTALSCDSVSPSLEPHERGWLEDILASRNHAFDLASEAYNDRMDDLRFQFLLAHVAAGLAFLHKVPRREVRSGGLTTSQYRQSFIWSAIFLRQLFQSVSLPIDQAFPGETNVPVLGKPVSTPGPTPSEADWECVKYFDANGFNVLVIAKMVDPIPPEILSLPWTLVVDFREGVPPEAEIQAMERPLRQTWPGEPAPDPKLMTRGAYGTLPTAVSIFLAPSQLQHPQNGVVAIAVPSTISSFGSQKRFHQSMFAHSCSRMDLLSISFA
jgi:hypothetical protein